MQTFRDAYDSAWKSIICPYQHKYNLHFYMPNLSKDLEIKQFSIENNMGKKISAIILKPKHIHKTKHCIFYFHGNGGSKLQALNFAPLICSDEVCVISFDFISCGNSDSGFLTYGPSQAMDAELVLRAALKFVQYEKLSIWGRSMGAVTAIVFAQKNYKIIDSLILDSPFRSLKEVVLRIIKQKTNLPSPLDTMLFYFLQKKIQQKVGIDIFCIDYVQLLKKIPKQISVFYIYSQNDNFISKQEIYEFFNNTKGQKDILKIDHEHQQDRSAQILHQGTRWMMKQKNKKVGKLKLFHKQIEAEIERQNIILIC